MNYYERTKSQARHMGAKTESKPIFGRRERECLSSLWWSWRWSTLWLVPRGCAVRLFAPA